MAAGIEEQLPVRQGQAPGENPRHVRQGRTGPREPVRRGVRQALPDDSRPHAPEGKVPGHVMRRISRGGEFGPLLIYLRTRYVLCQVPQVSCGD